MLVTENLGLTGPGFREGWLSIFWFLRTKGAEILFSENQVWADSAFGKNRVDGVRFFNQGRTERAFVPLRDHLWNTECKVVPKKAECLRSEHVE